MAAKPVYALVGEDSFLQLQKLAEIRALAPKDAQVIEVDGERAELADVLDELRSFAMFGGGKVVVVRGADDFISRFRESLEDYLAKPSDSATLVLRCNSLPKSQRVYKLIDKVGRIEQCEAPRPAQLSAWIIARGKTTHRLVVESAAASLLAACPSDGGSHYGVIPPFPLFREAPVLRQALRPTREPFAAERSNGCKSEGDYRS